MPEAVKPTRLIVGADTKPVLPRHIKLRHDQGRERERSNE